MDALRIYVTLQTAILWMDEGEDDTADTYVREAMDELWAELTPEQQQTTRDAAALFKAALLEEKP